MRRLSRRATRESLADRMDEVKRRMKSGRKADRISPSRTGETNSYFHDSFAIHTFAHTVRKSVDIIYSVAHQEAAVAYTPCQEGSLRTLVRNVTMPDRLPLSQNYCCLTAVVGD